MTTQGKRLKKIRKALDFTQEQFGEKLKMSKQYYSNIENDRTVLNNDKLAVLHNDYNVNLNYLFSGVGEMFNTPQFEDVKDDILKEIEEMLRKRGIT